MDKNFYRERIVMSNRNSCDYLGDVANYVLCGCELNTYQKIGALESLANTVSDDLSLALRSARYDPEKPVSFVDNIYGNSNIIEALVLRQIGKDDYNDFLSGKKPVAAFDGRDYFLRKCGVDSEGKDSYVLGINNQ